MTRSTKSGIGKKIAGLLPFWWLGSEKEEGKMKEKEEEIDDDDH